MGALGRSSLWLTPRYNTVIAAWRLEEGDGLLFVSTLENSVFYLTAPVWEVGLDVGHR